MDDTKPTPILKINDTFSSYEELRKAVERYERTNRVQFWTRDAKKLHRASPSVYQIVKDHPELEYCSLRLSCIHGGKSFQPKEVFKSSKRKSRGTWKQDCKAEIFIKLNDDKNRLVIQRLEEEHNHAIPSAEVFKQFPKPRRISGKRRIAQKFLVESKLKERIQSEAGIRIENIVKVNSLAQSNNFRKLDRLLREKYLCSVDLQTDDEDKIYGFFFQDKKMKKYFQLFPEILAIDGTYTLLNIHCSIYIFTIENSLGSSNIVGVGVLTNDSTQSLDWLLQRFKNRNSEWEETCIIMTDRQTSEHQIVPNHFPKVRTVICSSHAAYTFRKDISQMKKMNVTTTEIEECMTFFSKLMNAESNEDYSTILEDMEDTVAYVLMKYYHDKWDNLKHEWVKGLGAKITNYFNITLEDPNSKLRSAISSCKTFNIFIEKLFLHLYLQKNEFQNEFVKNFKIFHKRPTPTELQYQKHLTQYAFEKIKPHISLAENDISDIKFEYKTVKCDIVCEAGDQTFVVSEYSCVCDFFSLMKLPCEHILVYRKIENMNLFDEFLFSQRWTREYAEGLLGDERTYIPPKLEGEKNTDEKFVEAEGVCLMLATLCSEAETSEFEERLGLLMQLKRSWENKDKVSLQTIGYYKEADTKSDMEVDEIESNSKES